MPHILLVDDDPEILEIIELDLNDESGITVDTCLSSREALELIKKYHYDIIIADWKMPVMNGTALVKTARAGGNRSFFIIYSGIDICDDIEEALKLGADAYVHRKGDPDTEFAELRSLIKRADSTNTRTPDKN